MYWYDYVCVSVYMYVLGCMCVLMHTCARMGHQTLETRDD